MDHKTQTTALGDTIHAYAVLSRMDSDAPIVIHARYAPLFQFLSPRVQAGPFTEWSMSHPGENPGPVHGEHIRDTLARRLGVSNALIGVPLWGANRIIHRPYVLLCPDASKPHKEWPLSRWNRLDREILELGYDVRYCHAPDRAVDAPTLMEMVRLIQGATAVVSVDSGQAHLADAHGVPVIGLYGATSSTTYGPYTQRALTVDVHRTAWSLPAPYNSITHLNAFAMHQITVADVLAKLSIVFNRQGSHR